MTTQIAVLVAAAMWLVALRMDRDPNRNRHQSKHLPEFWWACAATATGGIGSLASFEIVPLSPDAVSLFRAVPLIVIGLLMVARPVLSRVAIVPIASGLLVVFFGVVFAHIAGGQAALMPILSLVLFAPALIAPRAGWNLTGIRSGLSAGLAVTLVVLSTLVVALPSALVGACRFDKCSVWGTSLGEAGAGNALGLFFAASTGIMLLSCRGLVSFLLTASAGLVLVDATSSRSAFYAYIVAVIAAVAFQTRRLIIAQLAALTVAIAAVVIPYLGWTGFDLTGRAILWQVARELFAESPLFGWGASYWVGQSEVPQIVANYSAHSIVPEMLVTAGLVGLIAFAGSLAAAMFARKERATRAYVAALIAITLGLSFTEVVSAPGRTYLLAGLIVLVYVASQSRESNTIASGISVTSKLEKPVIAPEMTGPKSTLASRLS